MESNDQHRSNSAWGVRLERVSGYPTLVVDGRPFLAVGGEVRNSSSSDVDYLSSQWERLARTGINTVLISVSWAEVERSEGTFDFTVVDRLVESARDVGLRLGVIWFGAFKNALSTYAPSWVRADTKRFPRAATPQNPLPMPFTYEGSSSKPVLSAFSPDLVAADGRAFAGLVDHLQDHALSSTVIMIQVENEIGLLGSPRDFSIPALHVWNSPVPDELRQLARSNPAALPTRVADRLLEGGPAASWASLFGNDDDDADETFMAWAFASYVEKMSAPVRPTSRVPFYTNAWLGPQPGQDRPGQYPSGGPTGRMLALWQRVAPSLDWLSPDIYIDDSQRVLAEYTQYSNPLFVPESRFSAGDLFLAVGGHDAIGYCTFGVEDGREGALFFEAARTVLAMSDLILDQRVKGNVWGFTLHPEQATASRQFGDITLTVRNGPALLAQMLLDVGVELPSPVALPSETLPGSIPVTGDSRPFGIVIRVAEDRYIVAGQAALFDFTSASRLVEIDEVRELVLEHGKLRRGRHLNGDERLTIVPQSGIGVAEITLIRPGSV